MDQTPEKSSYQEIVSLTLGGYQLIEARLKTYLHNYFRIVKFKIGNDLHFGFDGNDYNTAALGTLLKVFAKTCADSALIKDLQAEISHRDDIAHRALLVLFNREPCDPNELNTMANTLSTRAESITRLLKRLNEAHENLVAPYHEK